MPQLNLTHVPMPKLHSQSALDFQSDLFLVQKLHIFVKYSTLRVTDCFHLQASAKLAIARSPKLDSKPLFWAGRKGHWAELTQGFLCLLFCNITWPLKTLLFKGVFFFFFSFAYLFLDLHEVTPLCNKLKIHQFLHLLQHGLRQ